MEAKLFVFTAVAISEVFSACTPTNTKFENFQKSPKRSTQFTIGVTSKKCPGLNEFYYDWKVVSEENTDTIIFTSSKPSFTVSGYAFDSSDCFLQSYRVTVKVSHYPDMSYYDEVEDSFRFVPDRMHLEILGGSEKTHLLGDDLIVDAKKLSVDSSYPPYENSFAANVIRWTISPEIYGYSPPESLYLKVPGDLLRDDIYIFNLTVARTKIPDFYDAQSTFQIVEVITGVNPQLNIFCMRNCVRPHHLETTVFGINCTKNCEGVTYKWYVEPRLDQSMMDFGDGYDKLAILAGAYREGASVIVGVRSGGSRITLVFNFVSGMTMGTCDITPKEGISSVTKFKVKCKGFESPYGVVIYNIFQVLKDATILINEGSYHDESEVYLAADDPAMLRVEVQDNAFLQKEVVLKVVVTEYRPEENVEIIAGVKQLVLATDMTSITSYAVEGFHNHVVQLISSLLNTISVMKIDDGTVRDLHKHMAEALLHMHPGRFAIVHQRLGILLKLQKRTLESETVTFEIVGRVMTDNVFYLHRLRNHLIDSYIPQGFVEYIIFQTLILCSLLLRKREEILKILNDPTPVHDYDSYDEFVSRKMQIRDDFRKIIKYMMITVQTSCLTALYQTFPDENAKVYSTDLLIIQTERKSITNHEVIIYMLTQRFKTTTKIIIPNELTKELQKINYYIDFQMGVFKINPFWWHMNVTSIQTEVILFDLFVNCDEVKKVDNSFFIAFKILSMPMIEESGMLHKKKYVAYRVALEPYRALAVRFENVPEYYITYVVTWADCYCTEEDFRSERSKLIANSTDPIEKLLLIKNRLGSWKIVFICIKKLTTILEYKMKLTTFSCMYWEIAAQEWKGDGCHVISVGLETQKNLLCECQHFSLFSGQVLVPEISLIDAKEVDVAITIVKNYAVICVVLGIISLWIISLLLAHRKDKLMKKKNVVHKLDDNVPGDPYAYLVVFFTGFFFDAPTTADVAFQIIGDQAKSRVHLIKCKGFKVLQRNTQDWFTLYSPFYLGDLKKIKIWHNSKGKSPHWYCERVIIQDLQTGTQYCFIVEKWFSLTWGAKKTYRIINIDEHDPMKDTDILFWTHFEKDLKDKNIWISIRMRDVQSNFNSKERVSVGFVFLFLSMLANALFTGLPRGGPTDSIDEQPKYFLSVPQVIVFLESWLIATPMVLLLIFLFANSKPS